MRVEDALRVKGGLRWGSECDGGWPTDRVRERVSIRLFLDFGCSLVVRNELHCCCTTLVFEIWDDMKNKCTGAP